MSARAYIALYTIALAARIAMLVRGGAVRSPDSFGYRAAADAFVADPLTASPAFVDLPPVFPVFLALLPNDTAAVVAQAAVGALAAPLVAAIAARFGPAAVWVAGVGAALSPHLLQWTTYLLTDTIGVVLLLAAAWQAIAAQGGGVGRAAVAGLASGAAVLTRAAAAVVVAVFAFAQMGAGPSRLRRVAALIGVAGLIVGLAACRNAIAIGEVRPYRDQGMYLVWLGTMWNERGRGTAGVDVLFPPGYDSWPREKRDEFHRDAVLTFVRDRPIEYGALALRKALWFWLPVYPEWSLPHKILSGTFLCALYLLACLGLFAERRSPAAWTLAGAVAALTAIAAVTIVDFDARYRLPAETLLLPLAGAGAAVILARGRATAGELSRPRWRGPAG